MTSAGALHRRRPAGPVRRSPSDERPAHRPDAALPTAAAADPHPTRLQYRLLRRTAVPRRTPGHGDRHGRLAGRGRPRAAHLQPAGAVRGGRRPRRPVRRPARRPHRLRAAHRRVRLARSRRTDLVGDRLRPADRLRRRAVLPGRGVRGRPAGRPAGAGRRRAARPGTGPVHRRRAGGRLHRPAAGRPAADGRLPHGLPGRRGRLHRRTRRARRPAAPAHPRPRTRRRARRTPAAAAQPPLPRPVLRLRRPTARLQPALPRPARRSAARLGLPDAGRLAVRAVLPAGGGRPTARHPLGGPPAHPAPLAGRRAAADRRRLRRRRRGPPGRPHRHRRPGPARRPGRPAHRRPDAGRAGRPRLAARPRRTRPHRPLHRRPVLRLGLLVLVGSTASGALLDLGLPPALPWAALAAVPLAAILLLPGHRPSHETAPEPA